MTSVRDSPVAAEPGPPLRVSGAGDVDYLEPPMASPEAGQALLCCSYPRPSSDADEIVLDI